MTAIVTARVASLALDVVDQQLVAELLHRVTQDDVVDRVAGRRLFLHRLVGFMPAAGPFVDERDDLMRLFAETLLSHSHRLVDVALSGFVVDVHRATVDAGLSFGHTLAVFLVAL